MPFSLTTRRIQPLFVTVRSALAVVMMLASMSTVNGAGIAEIAESLASDVRDILEQHQLQMSVTVNSFEFNAYRASSGATFGIQKRLQDALRKKMIAVDGVDVAVSGRVTKNEYLLAVSCQVFDITNNRKYTVSFRGAPTDEKPVVLNDREDVISVLSPTFESNLNNEDPADRREVLDGDFEASIDAAECHLDGSSVFAMKDGRFGIQLLTKDSAGRFTRLPRVENRNGEAFVHLKEHDQLAVRIINHAEYDVGAKVLVDGLNSFVFAEEKKYQDGGIYLIRRLAGGGVQRAPIIKGWFLGLKNEAAFDVTTLPNSAAASLNRVDGGKVGTISVLFFPSWNESAGEKPPVDALGGRRQTKGLAMGVGKIQDANFAARSQNKFARTVISAITVRYARPE